MHTFDVVHPDDVAPSNRDAESIRLQKTDEKRMERRYLRKGGSSIWVDVASQSIPGDESTEPNSVGVVIDIGRRKRAEVKLMEQLTELQRWHQATLGRDGRVIQLKREVNELPQRLGESPRYSAPGNGAAQRGSVS